MSDMRWILCAMILLGAALWSFSSDGRAALAGSTGSAWVESGGVTAASIESSLLFTTGYEGSVLYVWDLRAADKPTVQVFRCKHSLGEASYRQEFDLPPRT